MMTAAAIVWRAVTIAALACLLYAVGVWAGPDVEALVAPAMRDQAIGDVERAEDGRACWTLTFAKARDARGVDAGWTIRADGRVWPFQRVITVADSDGPGEAIPPRPIRPGRYTRKCVDVPAELRARPFRVTGFVEYRTAATGWLWTVRQPTHEVVVP